MMKRDEEKPLLPDPPGGRAGVFCDSVAAGREVMRQAQAAGVEVTFLTRSPGMVDAFDNLDLLDDRLDPEMVREYSEGVRDLLDACYDHLVADPELRPLAVGLVRLLWMLIHEVINTLFLREEDLVERRYYVRHLTPEGRLVGPQAPWEELLKAGGNLAVSSFVAPVADVLRARSDHRERLALLMSDQRSYYWMKLIELWQRVRGGASYRGTYYFGKQIKPVADLGVQFARRGYRLLPIPAPGGRCPEPREGLTARAMVALDEAFAESIGRWLTAMQYGALRSLYERAFAKFIGEYDQAVEFYSSVVSRRPGDPPQLFVTNYPSGANTLALGNATAASGGRAALVGIQHGIAKELLEHRNNRINYETTFTDAAICMSDEAQRLLMENRYRRPGSKAFSAGFFLRKSGGRFAAERRKILLLEPFICRGYTFNGGHYDNQVALTAEFHRLYAEGLAGLRNPLVIKPYRTPSYAEEPAYFEVIRRSPRLELYELALDAAAMMPRFGALVTFGASSTMGYCMASGRPVIYVDSPAISFHLKESLAEPFKKWGFYVDGGEASWAEALRALLDQDLAEIERRWKAWAEERERLLAPAFGLNRRYEPRKVADFVESLIQSGT